MIVACTSCAATREPLEQPAGLATLPGPGDFWLCPSCGELHRFTGERLAPDRLEVRPATLDEVCALPESARRDLLMKMAEIIGKDEPPIDFVCPFCGLEATVAMDNGGGGVFHVAPICESFDRLEPEEYLAAVNDQLIDVGLRATGTKAGGTS